MLQQANSKFDKQHWQSVTFFGGFRFRRTWSQKKPQSVSENMFSEPCLGFGKFGDGKKSRYRFQSKLWSRQSVVMG